MTVDLLNALCRRFCSEKVEIARAGAKGLVVTIRSAKPISISDTLDWLRLEGFPDVEVVWSRTEETPEEMIARLQKELADECTMAANEREALCHSAHEAYLKLDRERAAHEETKRRLQVFGANGRLLCDERQAHGQTQAALEAERAAHEETKSKLAWRTDAHDIDGAALVRARKDLADERAAHEETKRKLELARIDCHRERWQRAIDRRFPSEQPGTFASMLPQLAAGYDARLSNWHPKARLRSVSGELRICYQDGDWSYRIRTADLQATNWEIAPL